MARVKKDELEKATTTASGKRTSSASKTIDAIQQLIIKTVLEDSTDEIFEQLKPTFDQKFLETYGAIPQVHEIRLPDETRTIPGVTHEKFDEVLTCAAMNIPVYLTGKAGTGKNVICKQVADALGLDFYFTNAVTQEYKLTGFIDAYGKYQETQFYKAFKDGGVFFLDEMDASIPEVLVILNAAIANGYFNFPCGSVDASPNFRVIAAGNTNGKGADNNYTGRYNLDGASLDRFAMIEIDYSPRIEESLCASNKELLDFVHAFRKSTDNAGIECLCSYRTIQRIFSLKDSNIPLPQVIKISLIKGLDKDDISILVDRLRTELPFEDNPYYLALKELLN